MLSSIVPKTNPATIYENDEISINSSIKRQTFSIPNGENHKCVFQCFFGYPLHYASKTGNDVKVSKLLKSDTDPFKIDCKGRNALHWAATSGNSTKSVKCMDLILNCKQLRTCPSSNYETSVKSLLNSKDKNGETPLHLAAKCESKKNAERLLLAKADYLIKSNEGYNALELLYKKIPESLICILNKAILPDDENESSENSNLLLKLNLSAICGLDTEGKDSMNEEVDTSLEYCNMREMKYVSHLADSNVRGRKSLMVHPVLRAFLHMKWKRIQHFFTASILFHVLFLLLYTYLIVEIYLIKCSYEPQVVDLFKNIVLPRNENVSEINVSDLENKESKSCKLEIAWKVVSFLLFFLTSLLVVKEVFQISSAPNKQTYFTSLEKVGQWVLFTSVFVIALPLFSSEKIIEPWQYQVSAFGIFLAWVLILAQIGKIPKFGIYVEILIKVLKIFGIFVLTFASLLIAFALSLSILLPTNGSFSSVPLAVLKVLVMMTGELNYDEVFEDGKQKEDGKILPYATASHLMYGSFAIVVAVILVNLLIGLTVTDIQGLRKGAEISRLRSEINNILMIESFILSWESTVSKYINISSIIQSFFLLDPKDAYVKIQMDDVPKELQGPIRRLASLASAEKFNAELEKETAERKLRKKRQASLNRFTQLSASIRRARFNQNGSLESLIKRDSIQELNEMEEV